MGSELMLLACGVLHKHEDYRRGRWQTVLLDGLSAEDMSSYRITWRRVVPLRSMATGFSDELIAVNITS